MGSTDIAASDALAVLLYDTPAGELVRQNGRLSFRYLPSYQAMPGATPLSLSMPLQVAEHSHRVIEAFLWGLLPDSADVLTRWAREYGVSARNPFALLSHVGEDCAGAVQFVLPDRIDALSAGSVEWLEEEQIAHRIRMLRQDPTSWQLTGTAGQWSLAGAQAKTALHFDGQRWGRPTGTIPTTHILKPAVTGLDDHDLNEHLCLDLARRLGLTAARSRVRDFAGERVIVVTRYDRVEAQPGWVRVHQEDLCQALAVPPSRKYQNDGGPSAERIVALLRATMSADDADRAVRAFVDALALNWLLVGTGAHAKNYSVLLSGSTVRLAPLYDVASALPYDDSAGHRLTLPMKIGGRYDLAYIGRDNWERLAQALGLDLDETVARVLQLARQVPDALAEACAADDVRALGGPLPDLLLDAVSAHATRCVHRLELASSAAAPQLAWTPGHVQTLLQALAEPQRRLLLAVVSADGALAAGDLRLVLGTDRTSLRGVTGPVTKTIQRLQRSRQLPADLPRPVQTRSGVDEQGYRRVEVLTMPPGTVAAFRAALAAPVVNRALRHDVRIQRGLAAVADGADDQAAPADVR